MTTEEKARAYDKALEIARKLYNSEETSSDVEIACENIFPELKESEDEKIKKELIKHLKDGAEGYEPAGNCEDYKRWLSWVEKQGEQKSVDKIEPKFHKGDWTVSNLDGKARQILEVHYDEYNNYYVVENDARNIEEYDRLHHLWTIQDAKNGDVLSYRDGQWIFIYKKQDDDNLFHYYSLYSTIHQDLTIDDSAFTLLIDGIVPATQEQRNILFQKMKEDGLEWDADKKELNKIEQKSTWSEEDENRFKNLVMLVNCSDENEPTKRGFINFINRLKSIKPQPKQEWSEEDKKIINRAISAIYSLSNVVESKQEYEELSELADRLQELINLRNSGGRVS